MHDDIEYGTDYYDQQARRGENAARVIVLLWVFISGSVAGWFLNWLI